MPFNWCIAQAADSVFLNGIQKTHIWSSQDFPEVLGANLVDNLMEQIKPFPPSFTLGERAETIETLKNGSFIVTTNRYEHTLQWSLLLAVLEALT